MILETKKRRFEIAFEPIQHKYTVKGYEKKKFTSVTTYIHEKFFPTDEEFAISSGMAMGIKKKIKTTIQEFKKIRKDNKRKVQFLSNPENIKHVTKLVLLDNEKCFRCTCSFSEEEVKVKYLYKEKVRNQMVYTEKEETTTINKCGACHNRFPTVLSPKENDKEIQDVDITALWQISREDGTNLHAFIENYFNGVYKQEDDLLMAAYATRGGEAFLHFQKAVLPQLKIIHSEFRVASVKYGISGTIDAIGYVNGKKSIIDWKGVKSISEENSFNKLNPPFDFLRPNKLGKYAAQIALYRLLYLEEFPDEDIERGFIVCFDPLKEGTYDIYELKGFKIFSEWIAECVEATDRKQPLKEFTRYNEVYWEHVNRPGSHAPYFEKDNDWDI